MSQDTSKTGSKFTWTVAHYTLLHCSEIKMLFEDRMKSWSIYTKSIASMPCRTENMLKHWCIVHFSKSQRWLLSWVSGIFSLMISHSQPQSWALCILMVTTVYTMPLSQSHLTHQRTSWPQRSQVWAEVLGVSLGSQDKTLQCIVGCLPLELSTMGEGKKCTASEYKGIVVVEVHPHRLLQSPRTLSAHSQWLDKLSSKAILNQLCKFTLNPVHQNCSVPTHMQFRVSLGPQYTMPHSGYSNYLSFGSLYPAGSPTCTNVFD